MTPSRPRRRLSAESAGPPTSTARAARSLAEGLLLIARPAVRRRRRPARPVDHGRAAAARSSRRTAPAALVTLAALHGGDPVRARSVIGRAVRAGGDGRRLLGSSAPASARLGADAGRSAGARRRADAASVAGRDLHRRDALWAAALQTAIARRSGDSGAVQKHWYAAMEVLAEYSVDLFSLLPLGELWVAAARLRQVDRLQHTARRGVRSA